jgi:hypothetical protein
VEVPSHPSFLRLGGSLARIASKSETLLYVGGDTVDYE